MNRTYSFDHGSGGVGGVGSNIGGLGGYQPLCFSKEAFISESFKVDAFIADCRRRVPLESVQKDLKEYTKHLDAELVELINKEYHSFFSLSSSLAGIDVVLNEFNDTLSNIKSEISTFKGDIHKVRECVEDKLKEKKKIEHTKKLLQLYISISDSISNVDSLFEQLGMVTNNQQQSSSSSLLFSPPTSLHSNLSLELVIDRISNSFFQIQRQIESLSPDESVLKIFQNLQMRVLELSNKIELNIDPIFQESLQTSIKSGNMSSVEVLSNCLKTYQVIKKIHIPYKIFRKFIIKPHLINLITTKNLELNSKGSCEGLPTIYSSIITFLQSNCSELFMVSNSINTYYDNNTYNFISESVMPEIDEQLSMFRQIFATGIPDLFFRTYTHTNQFVAALEDMCLSASQVHHLRSSPAYQSLYKRWNFAVYFQLRFSDIASSFERQLQSVQLYDTIVNFQNPIEKNDFYITQSFSLCQHLDNCWSKNIFIYELTPKFLKLFLQLVARYDYYIQELLGHFDQHSNSSGNTTTTTSSTSTTPSNGSSLNGNGTNGNNGTTPKNHLSPNIDSQDSKSMNKQTPEENLVYLYSDLLKLITKLSNHYRNVITNTIRNPSKEIDSIISDGTNESVQTLQLILPRMTIIITNHFIKKCSESLILINALSSHYRLTNKPFPTTASQYVSLIVNPLESYLTNKATTIPADIKLEWVKTIITKVSEKFLMNANDLLSSVTKSNDILNKMIKRNNTGTAAGSDIDKISLQLYLDVVKYGTLVSKLGIDTNTFTPFTNLYQLVEPFKKYIQQ